MNLVLFEVHLADFPICHFSASRVFPAIQTTRHLKPFGGCVLFSSPDQFRRPSKSFNWLSQEVPDHRVTSGAAFPGVCSSERGPSRRSAEAAMAQMNEALEIVEDTHSGIPKDPNPSLDTGGRMYPAQVDRIVKRADGAIKAVSRGHVAQYGANGSMRVTERVTGKVVFQKP